MRMRAFSGLLLPALALMACDTILPDAEAEPDLVFFFEGYRDDADPCRQLAETEYTNQFLDDAADLVGCPEGNENIGVFITETGAQEVGRRNGFVLFTVPRR